MLDLAGRLAEYAWMSAASELPHDEPAPATQPRSGRSRRTAWALGLLATALITALAFAAYRQPELLLNFMGLRYCG